MTCASTHRFIPIFLNIFLNIVQYSEYLNTELSDTLSVTHPNNHAHSLVVVQYFQIDFLEIETKSQFITAIKNVSGYSARIQNRQQSTALRIVSSSLIGPEPSTCVTR